LLVSVEFIEFRYFKIAYEKEIKRKGMKKARAVLLEAQFLTTRDLLSNFVGTNRLYIFYDNHYETIVNVCLDEIEESVNDDEFKRDERKDKYGKKIYNFNSNFSNNNNEIDRLSKLNRNNYNSINTY
jgi:hypothetical protein